MVKTIPFISDLSIEYVIIYLRIIINSIFFKFCTRINISLNLVFLMLVLLIIPPIRVYGRYRKCKRINFVYLMLLIVLIYVFKMLLMV